MKSYYCTFCGTMGTRKIARTCIKTHVKIDKEKRKSKRTGSNVTEFLGRLEL